MGVVLQQAGEGRYSRPGNKKSDSPGAERSTASADRIPASELRGAIRALQGLPEESAEAVRMRSLIVESFEAAMPELLREGQCVETALELPLFERGEPPLKRCLLLLGRSLRQERDGLPAAELPHVPRLLQRVGLQDHILFDDFCAACSRSWPELDETSLHQLFLAVEDYSLPHTTHGPSLARLAGQLAAGFGDTAARPPPASQAALACAALAPQQRGLCRPLLEQLRETLSAEAEDATSRPAADDAVLLLAGAAELQAAIVGSTAAGLQRLAVHVTEGFSKDQPILPSDENVGAMLRACTSLWQAAPEATDALFRAVLDAIGEEASRTAFLCSCRHLCAPLRCQLVKHLLSAAGPAEVASSLDLEGAEAWLHLTVDLPSTLSAVGDSRAHAEMVAVIAAVLERLFFSADNPEVRCSTFVVAHLAASSTAHSLNNAEAAAADDSGATFGILLRHAGQALTRLEEHWPSLEPAYAQMLFRCPGDCTKLARWALDHLDRVKDAKTQVALLGAAVVALPGEDLSARWEPLLGTFLKQTREAGDLFAAEATLRRIPCSSAETARLRASLRQQAFRKSLEAPVAWRTIPPRGYVRYVEQSLRRSRESAPTAPVEEMLVERRKAAMPKRESAGVAWHRGMMGWEVRLEVQGPPNGFAARVDFPPRQRILGGYFKPQDDTEEGLERAKEAALEHYSFLEKHYFRKQQVLDRH